jgi:hypothetical protein
MKPSSTSCPGYRNGYEPKQGNFRRMEVALVVVLLDKIVQQQADAVSARHRSALQ